MRRYKLHIQVNPISGSDGNCVAGVLCGSVIVIYRTFQGSADGMNGIGKCNNIFMPVQIEPAVNVLLNHRDCDKNIAARTQRPKI